MTEGESDHHPQFTYHAAHNLYLAGGAIHQADVIQIDRRSYSSTNHDLAIVLYHEHPRIELRSGELKTCKVTIRNRSSSPHAIALSVTDGMIRPRNQVTIPALGEAQFEAVFDMTACLLPAGERPVCVEAFDDAEGLFWKSNERVLYVTSYPALDFYFGQIGRKKRWVLTKDKRTYALAFTVTNRGNTYLDGIVAFPGSDWIVKCLAPVLHQPSIPVEADLARSKIPPPGWESRSISEGRRLDRSATLDVGQLAPGTSSIIIQHVELPLPDLKRSNQDRWWDIPLLLVVNDDALAPSAFRYVIHEPKIPDVVVRLRATIEISIFWILSLIVISVASGMALMGLWLSR